MRTDPRLYDLAAAGLTAGLSGLELVRLIAFANTTKGLSLGATLAMGILFCVVLAAAAVGLALHRRAGWIAGMFAFLMALSYGSILRSGGNWIGAVYMLASAGILVSLIKDLPGYYPADELSPSSSAS